MSNALLDALGYVGESLDKPGAAVRGLLAGKPRELLNAIPFSDSMGLTDPAERVSGRGLLEQWGALNPNEDGLDWGDVAGASMDVATNPFTWAGGGFLANRLLGRGTGATQTAHNGKSGIKTIVGGGAYKPPASVAMQQAPAMSPMHQHLADSYTKAAKGWFQKELNQPQDRSALLENLLTGLGVGTAVGGTGAALYNLPSWLRGPSQDRTPYQPKQWPAPQEDEADRIIEQMHQEILRHSQ